MMRLSDSLVVLIATADDIMRRPAREMPTALPEAFTTLASDIRRIDSSPAEGIRSTRAGVMMINAIEGFFEHGDDRWQILIGATLPVLRREAWQASRSEKETAQEKLR